MVGCWFCSVGSGYSIWLLVFFGLVIDSVQLLFGPFDQDGFFLLESSLPMWMLFVMWILLILFVWPFLVSAR